MRFTENGVTYNLRDDNTLEVESFSPDLQYVVIQSFVNRYPVTRVKFRAAWKHRNLVSVTFPKTMQDLGIECFSCCEQLLEVHFCSKIASLHRAAFAECGRLQKVTGQSIRMDAPDVFSGCARLESLNVVCQHNIPYKSFDNCKYLREITCGKDVIVDDSAFDGCVSLEKFILLGDAIVSRDMWAFIAKREIVCPENSRFAEMAYSGTKVLLV